MREATLIYAHEIQAKDAHCNCTRASPSSSSSSSSSSQNAQKQPQDVEYDPPCPQILTQVTFTVPRDGSYQQLQKKDPLNLELSKPVSQFLLQKKKKTTKQIEQESPLSPPRPPSSKSLLTRISIAQNNKLRKNPKWKDKETHKNKKRNKNKVWGYLQTCVHN